jgi:hypothetical protein
MNTRTVNDIWAPLGEAKWKELAEGSNASELQLKFAAARFGGMNASAAAKAAGYSGDKDAIRRAGYSALRSTAVQALLELAAINAPLDARITEKEIDAKLARLIRSGDPLTMLKATELHQKREAARAAELATAKEEPEITQSQFYAHLISALPSDGAGAALAVGFHVSGKKLPRIAWFPFLKEVAPVVSRKYPENWQRWRAYCDNPTLASELAYIDHCAAGPLLEGNALIAAVRGRCPEGRTQEVSTGLHDFKAVTDAA